MIALAAVLDRKRRRGWAGPKAERRHVAAADCAREPSPAQIKVNLKMPFADVEIYGTRRWRLGKGAPMDFAQISSTLGDFLDAAIHPSVSNLPAGFLLLILAVLGVAALPEGARRKVRLAGFTAAGLIVSLGFTWPLTWARF